MANEAILFQDDLKNSLADDWAWLRQHSDYWRHTPEGLEIRVEPGKADDVKNALLHPAPDRAQGAFAIEVDIFNHTPPTQPKKNPQSRASRATPPSRRCCEWGDGQ